MKLLVDVNIIMDVLGRRRPYYGPASLVWAAVEQKHVEGAVCAVTLPTVFYLTRKKFGRSHALAGVDEVRQVFSIAAVDQEVIDAARKSDFADFEDAVPHFSGLQAGATHIVTRDKRGFISSSIPVIPPEQLPSILRSKP